MPQPVFVKVAGFDEAERHALNTIFRLSADRAVIYTPWMHDSPQPASLALVDGDSYEAVLDFARIEDASLKLIWIGDQPPPGAWRTFDRPIAWHEVVGAMDELFLAPSSEPASDIDFDLEDMAAQSEAALDFDLGVSAQDDGPDTEPPDTVPPPPQEPGRRALIVGVERDDRLYLRAKLALSGLTLADEAETGAQALELARANHYTLAMIDFELPDLDGWTLLRELSQSRPAIPHIIATTHRLPLKQRLRSWFAGTDGFFVKPPNPTRLQKILDRI